jgi:hypothetical protein
MVMIGGVYHNRVGMSQIVYYHVSYEHVPVQGVEEGDRTNSRSRTVEGAGGTELLNDSVVPPHIIRHKTLNKAYKYHRYPAFIPSVQFSRHKLSRSVTDIIFLA